MNIAETLTLLQPLVEQPLLLGGTIILISLLLEDLATITAALIAAQTEIVFAIPLTALFMGIVLGDIGLYCLGKYATKLPFIARHTSSEKLQRTKAALADNLLLAILTSRCVPGMRLPTYVAVGASGIAFRRFFVIALCAITVWTGLLFSLFYTLGEAANMLADELKWWALGGLVIAFFTASFFIKRRKAKSLKAAQ